MFVNLIRQLVPRAIRNVLRKPNTSFHRLKSKMRFAWGGVDVVEPRSGWNIRCHPLCPDSFSVFRTDPEQAVELEDFISCCKPGMKLLDVGAHWGLFCLAAIQFGRPNPQVLAVEASPNAARVLRTNLQLNEVSEFATVVIAAAGAECGEVEMLTTGAGGADYFVIPTEARPDTIRVPQATLSAICRQHAFEPSHLKIDVEGFEEEVLEGAKDIIQQYNPTIFLELHGKIIRSRGRDPRAVLAKLDQLGYRQWKQKNHHLNLRDLEKSSFNARFVCLPDSDLRLQ